jgi:hypothetical protein
MTILKFGEKLRRHLVMCTLRIFSPNSLSFLSSYVPFDFHNECRKMRFDNISRLVDNIGPDLEKQSYFHLNPDGTLATSQKSVVRTNCMDCLDRTNVTQAALARRALLVQLGTLEIIPPKSILQDYKDFDRMLMNGKVKEQNRKFISLLFFLIALSFFLSFLSFPVWADNADAVSMVYSGTGALKTDFTRTGKRTTAGSVQDGVNSAIRYLKNNYMDGFRQDAMDLFLGNYSVRSGQPSPFPNLENNDNALRRKLVKLLNQNFCLFI